MPKGISSSCRSTAQVKYNWHTDFKLAKNKADNSESTEHKPLICGKSAKNQLELIGDVFTQKVDSNANVQKEVEFPERKPNSKSNARKRD